MSTNLSLQLSQLVSEPGAVAMGSSIQVECLIGSHPPPHAGCPRGDPGPLPVLTRKKAISKNEIAFFISRLPGSRPEGGQWLCLSKPGRPTPLSLFRPVVLSGLASLQTRLPDPLRES